LRRFSDFTYTDLPAESETPRRFWPELVQVFGYHLWRRFGNLKLAINRQPWLRNMLVPLVRLARKVMHRP